MLAIYIRSLVLVCFAVLAMRLMGKRQVGQLQPFELVVAIMIADLASTPMESLDIPLWRGIIPLAATVTPSPDMYTTQSEKSFAISVFSSCVSSIDQFAIAAIAFIALSIVSCDALSALAAVCKSPSASSREVWRVSRAWAK